MSSVFIDESGNFGKQSAWLIFASIETSRPRVLEKAMRKIWRAKPQLHKHGELHANTVDHATKVRVLKTIAELDVAIRYISIEKATKSEPMTAVYYHTLAKFIERHPTAHTLIVDRKDTDTKRRQILLRLGLTNVFTMVIFEESHKVKQLQAVDFVAWAIGRQHEQDDATYMDLIREKLV